MSCYLFYLFNNYIFRFVCFFSSPYLSVFTSILWLNVYLKVYLSGYLYTYISINVYLSACLSFKPFLFVFFNQSIPLILFLGLFDISMYLPCLWLLAGEELWCIVQLPRLGSGCSEQLQLGSGCLEQRLLGCGWLVCLGRATTVESIVPEIIFIEALESVMCDVIIIRLKRRDEGKIGKGNP